MSFSFFSTFLHWHRIVNSEQQHFISSLTIRPWWTTDAGPWWATRIILLLSSFHTIPASSFMEFCLLLLTISSGLLQCPRLCPTANNNNDKTWFFLCVSGLSHYDYYYLLQLLPNWMWFIQTIEGEKIFFHSIQFPWFPCIFMFRSWCFCCR